MKSDRSWVITEKYGVTMIVTTLVDGSEFAYPVNECSTLSEWLDVVKEIERDRVEWLMDSKVVYEFPDQKSQA